MLSPFALVKQIREVYAGTIILAGAMSTGADVLAAQAMGADLAYLGTRFIATQEANAPQEYKQMLIDSDAEDIVYTVAVQRGRGELPARQRAAHGTRSGQSSPRG